MQTNIIAFLSTVYKYIEKNNNESIIEGEIQQR